MRFFIVLLLVLYLCVSCAVLISHDTFMVSIDLLSLAMFVVVVGIGYILYMFITLMLR